MENTHANNSDNQLSEKDIDDIRNAYQALPQINQPSTERSKQLNGKRFKSNGFIVKIFLKLTYSCMRVY